MIIAKNFAPKLQYFEIFCNNDDCCNEPLKKFWYNDIYVRKMSLKKPKQSCVSVLMDLFGILNFGFLIPGFQ